jgi:RNA polymerase sigma-70 factor (ECF subfamily)
VDGGILDRDLVLLARAGDQVAFGFLVERYRRTAQARAVGLCRDAGEAEDIVQEAFLQAFLRLDRLRDPDRFAGWLAGIVVNVHRASRRRRVETVLLGEWPQPLHPPSADGLPEQAVEDRDRCDAVRAALAGLPAEQRRAVTLFYLADLPVAQIADRFGDSPGAVKARLHKARARLRDRITADRPDLIPPCNRRTSMTTVRIAHAEPRPDRTHIHHVLVVLADDNGRRVLPIWLMGMDGHSLRLLLERDAETDGESVGVPEELTDRLLRATGVSVTGVDIDELGPDLPVARIHLATPGGPHEVTSRLADGLAMAVVQRAPIRVSDILMDRLGEPIADGDMLRPFLDRRPPAPAPTGRRPPGPHNLGFAHGLDGWDLRGSFLRSPTSATWQDYQARVTPEHCAVLAAAVPQPHGFADLRQANLADHHRGRNVTFRAQVRSTGTGQAAVYLRTVTEQSARTNTDNRILAMIEPGRDWTDREATTVVPDDAVYVLFGVTLTGPGEIEVRGTELLHSP